MSETTAIKKSRQRSNSQHSVMNGRNGASALATTSAGQAGGFMSGIQSKLVVGRANDPFEREADQVADFITNGRNGSAPTISSIGPGGLSQPGLPAQKLSVQRDSVEPADEEALGQGLLLQRMAADEEPTEENPTPQGLLLQRVEEEQAEEEPPGQGMLLQRMEMEEDSTEEEPSGQGLLLQREEQEPPAEEPPTEEPVQELPIQRCGCGQNCSCGQNDESPHERNVQRMATEEEEPETNQQPVQTKSSPTHGTTGSLSHAIKNPGPGEPINPPTQRTLETGLGVGLSDVRVHSNGSSRQTAHALKARAFTQGKNIWLGPGESQNDIGLMAHEATHVVQQTSGPGSLQAAQRNPSNGKVAQRQAEEETNPETTEEVCPTCDQVSTGTCPECRQPSALIQQRAAHPGSNGILQLLRRLVPQSPAEEDVEEEGTTETTQPVSASEKKAEAVDETPDVVDEPPLAFEEESSSIEAPEPTETELVAEEAETAGEERRAAETAIPAQTALMREDEGNSDVAAAETGERQGTETSDAADEGGDSAGAIQAEGTSAEAVSAEETSSVAEAIEEGTSREGDLHAIEDEAAEGEDEPEADEVQGEEQEDGEANAEVPEAAALEAAVPNEEAEPTSVEGMDAALTAGDERRSVAIAHAEETGAALTATGAEASRLASTEVKFAEIETTATSGTQEEQRTLAMGIANGFMGDAARRVEDMVSVGKAIHDKVLDTFESAKDAVDVALVEEGMAVSNHIAQVRAQAKAESRAARGQIGSKHRTTVAAIKASTVEASTKVKEEYDTSLSNLSNGETAQLGEIDKLYADGDSAYRAAGVDAGKEAVKKGAEKAAKYRSQKIHRKDSFMSGYLTDRRAEARAKAAEQVSKAYDTELTKYGEEQAEKAMEGKEKDYGTVRTTTNKVRETLKAQYDNALAKLAKHEKKSIAGANKAKTKFIQSANETLSATLRTLRQQEIAQLQALEDTSEAQIAAIEGGAQETIATLQRNVNHGAMGLLGQLSSFQASLSSTQTPDVEGFGNSLALMLVQINAGASDLRDQIGDSTTSAKQNILGGGKQAVEALTNIRQSATEEATMTGTALTTSQSKLVQGANKSFSQQRKASKKTADDTAASAAAGFKGSVDGMNAFFKQNNKNMKEAFEKATKGLKQALLDTDKKMFATIKEKAKEAASKEKPAWKSVLKWVLIIAVIIVVAIVAGPLVIGAVGMAGSVVGAGALATFIGTVAVGAALGAAAGAVIQMGSNVIDGEDLFKDIGKAIVIGAIGGALGGFGGALGQTLGQAGKLGAGMTQTVLKFGIDVAADIGGGILGNLAVGDRITWEGVLWGAAIGAGVSVGVGFGLGKLAPKPGVDVPGGVRPDVDVPGGARPDVDVPGGTRPDVDVPSGARPDVETPGGLRPEADIPGGIKSDTDVPSSARPDADAPKRSAHPDEPEVEPGVVAKTQGADGHEIKVLKDGTVARCSADCAKIRQRYADELKDPRNEALKDRLDEIEGLSNPTEKARLAERLESDLAGLRKAEQALAGTPLGPEPKPLVDPRTGKPFGADPDAKPIVDPNTGRPVEPQPEVPTKGGGPNDLTPREVSSPTKGKGGVYQFEIDAKVKTGSTGDFRGRYGGKNITTEYPQTRWGPAADDSAYRWTPRRQRRFDEEFLDRKVPSSNRYRAADPKAPVDADKWKKYRHIFGYGSEPG